MTINFNNYIYLVLINFAICVGVFLIYFGLNYLFDFKLIKKFAVKLTKNYKRLFDVIFGMIMGGLSFFGILLAYQWYPETRTIIVLYLPLLLVFGVSYKQSLFFSFLITILSSLILLAIFNDIGFLNIVYHIILVIITSCFVVTIRLLKLKNNRIFNFAFILIYIGLLILIFYLLFKNQPIENILIQSLFILLLYLICYFSSNYIQNFITKINELNKASNFEINNFYKENFAFKTINESKSKNKLGLMVIINFTNIFNLPIQLGNHMSNYMQQKLLDCFVDALRQYKPIFFITRKNEYALYIPLNNVDLNNLSIVYEGNDCNIRKNGDPLKTLETHIQNIPHELVFGKQKIQVNFQLSCSIYGLHSYDNVQLINMCRLSIKNNNSTSNIIKVYNPLKDVKPKINYEEIKKLQKYFGPKSLEIKLANTKYGWYTPKVSSVDHLLFDIEDIKEYTSNKGIYTIMLRWICMQSLQKYKDIANQKPILIEYPLGHLLSNNFNINGFKRKINLLNIEFNKIVFKLNLLDINLEQNKMLIYQNIKLIEDLGIKTYFYNFDERYVDIIKIVKPNWISINEKLEKYDEYYKNLKLLISKFGINLI